MYTPKDCPTPLGMPEADPGCSSYAATTRKRCRSVAKSTPYQQEEKLIAEQVRRANELGYPLMMSQLEDRLCAEALQPELKDTPFMAHYITGEDGVRGDALKKKLERLLKKYGFSARSASIGQTIPNGWRQKAEAGAKVRHVCRC
eukprot:GHVU01145674.1.p1 GENE.GHVU01145674.1~~GHVU01145674.1.p1  ORF type:complete len:155 (-),score=21.38 GHVU01145674.1:919-1353(-)